MNHNKDLTLGHWFKQVPDQASNQFLICGGNKNLTNLDIFHRVAFVQNKMLQSEIKSCALFTDETDLFVTVFLACACTGVELILPANNTEELIQAVEADWHVGDLPDSQLFDLAEVKSSAPKHLSDGFEVVVFTSGSTGQPKRISRNIGQLLAEVSVLHATWSINQPATVFAATVSHQHIYGLLFKILWPLLGGYKIWHKIIPFEEALDGLLDKFQHVVLISSPAFLKRIHDQHPHQNQFKQVFSSGGFLSQEQQQQAEIKLDTRITQVYGSSETGGIAHRQLNQSWQPLNQVEVQVRAGLLWVKSPFCFQHDWLCTEDLVTFNDQGFELMGRNDRIVKIEEKRISLQQVERLMVDLEWIEDAAVIIQEDGRQYLAALIVLNTSGQQQLDHIGPLKLKHVIKQQLDQQLENVAIPRRISFTSDPLENSQGKRTVADLLRRLQ